MTDETLEEVKPFNPDELKTSLDKSNVYISFEPNEQKELIVTSPQNVSTKRFQGVEKLLLRLQVVKLNGEQCSPPKQWDVTNPALIRQLMIVLATKASAWRLIVKRGSGLNKATTYTIMHLPMEN